MLTEAFSLVLQLQPLAFGPQAPRPFDPPRALVCPIRDLGRLQEPVAPFWPAPGDSPLNSRQFHPVPEPYLVNRAVDTLLFLGAAIVGRASWVDDRPWFNRTVHVSGLLDPSVFPAVASPAPR